MKRFILAVLAASSLAGVLTVTYSLTPEKGWGIASFLTESSTRSATVAACSGVQSGKSTANSSPPSATTASIHQPMA